uniref:Uncharacterized protein n=1 Tax=Hyaloperonospora arabidopsidis (strain Emoy2) TaxID=559515 RepID=M4C1Q9_HYAAE
MSWLFDRKGRRYQLNGASSARGRDTLGDNITWSWAECGVVCFTPTISISSMPMAKRRHFGRFCFALVFNFPSFLYQPASPGTLVPLSGTVRRPHKWMLNPRGNMLSHWVSGHFSGTFCVGSMEECDTIADRIGGSPVQFVDHPALTRIVQPWAGHQQSPLTGIGLQGIGRAPIQHALAADANELAMQVHWRQLLDLWRCFGEFEDANIHVWVFTFRLPACPRAALAAATTWITANDSTEVAQASVFAAANELWCFVVASTTHSIWFERLCQMQDPTLLPEEH